MLKLLQPDFPPLSEWERYLEQAYAHHYFSNFSPNVVALEGELSEYLGTDRSVVTVSSATSGIAATLMALGIKGPVAVPSFTFPASASAIYQAGCTPIHVDVCPELWEMQRENLENLANPSALKAILHVRPFGIRRHISSLCDFAKDLKIPLIVDAAAGFGSTPEGGQQIDPQEDIAAEIFSFHATKPFSVGEGGCVVAFQDLAHEVRAMTNFSLNGRQMGYRWGLNAKMSDVTAAIGRAALRNFAPVLEYRRAQAHRWSELFSGIDKVQVPVRPGLPSWQLFPIRCKGLKSSDLQHELASRGVQSRVYYHPAINVYSNPSQTPNAQRLASEMISLPIGRHLCGADQDRVLGIIREWIDARV